MAMRYYEDRLSLEDREYYYSIVPTDGLDEYESYSTLKVIPQLVLTIDEAIERNLIGESLMLMSAN